MQVQQFNSGERSATAVRETSFIDAKKACQGPMDLLLRNLEKTFKLSQKASKYK